MSVVDEIKERLDIVEVIQAYVPLKKAGRNYKGLCPFHTEKTPSFVVFPETGTWHCFGACGTGGDLFTFIMKRENLGFGEALAILAQRAGVELEPRRSQSPELEKRLDLLREINQAAAVYFHHLLLHSDEAARARAYLEKRGLQPGTIDRFQVGYALDQWDALLRYLTGKGYAVADVAEAGLIIEREDRSGYYDRFRGRVIFPIRDPQGRTLGFGARILGEGTPKYLNSPQTALFDKGSVLFGLDQAKAAIRTTGQAVLVEGYMDVLTAHQHGIQNVVAQMGTALTEAQLALLKRYTRRFVLALDADLAGDQATLRGLEVARQTMDREVVPVPTPQGLIRFEDRLAAEIRIVSLPADYDPDLLIRESPTRWDQLIAQARPVMDYYFDVLTADLDLSTAKGKAEAVRLLGPLLIEIGDSVQRTHYLQQLARMVQVDERTLWQQIRRIVGKSTGTRTTGPRPTEKAVEEKPAFRLDEHCLSLVLAHPELLGQVNEALQAWEEPPFGTDDLGRPEDQAILNAWRDWLGQGGIPNARGSFYDTLDEPLQQRVDLLFRIREGQPPVPEICRKDEVLDAILQLRVRNLQRQNHELRFLHEEAQASGDREAFRRYGQFNIAITARLRRLQRVINDRSISGRRQQYDRSIRMLSA